MFDNRNIILIFLLFFGISFLILLPISLISTLHEKIPKILKKYFKKEKIIAKKHQDRDYEKIKKIFNHQLTNIIDCGKKGFLCQIENFNDLYIIIKPINNINIFQSLSGGSFNFLKQILKFRTRIWAISKNNSKHKRGGIKIKEKIFTLHDNKKISTTRNLKNIKKESLNQIHDTIENLRIDLEFNKNSGIYFHKNIISIELTLDDYFFLDPKDLKDSVEAMLKLHNIIKKL